jgi:hypothetical protein
MPRVVESAVAIVFTSLTLLGCGGSQSPPEAAPAAQPTANPPPPSPENAPARPELTAEECEQKGGTVVGDIGDGAIHRADYRCPGGAAPVANIRAPGEGPIGVEGSVCCPK